MATSQSVHERQCPECEQPGEDDGTDVVCPQCGMVIDTDPVEHGEKEWWDYEHVENYSPRERAGPPTDPNLHNRGLGSSIGYRGDGSGGGNVNARQESIHNHAQTGSKRDTNRGYATTEIQRMATALEVGQSVAKQAKHLFRQYHESGGALGNDLDTIAAACLYHVVRTHGLGRSPGDIATVARTEERWIIRQHRRLCNDLGIGCPPPDARQRVRVVASDLGLEGDAAERAVAILDDAPGHVVGSGSPSTLAGGALYLATEGVTQRKIAEAAGCTEVSVRHRMEDLEG